MHSAITFPKFVLKKKNNIRGKKVDFSDIFVATPKLTILIFLGLLFCFKKYPPPNPS